jgi:hypothetical protein
MPEFPARRDAEPPPAPAGPSPAADGALAGPGGGRNPTHDPALTSWVASANGGASDFPIQNLPYGVFRQRGSDDAFHIGVAIGD